jgi:hypothetical protein
MRLLDSIMGVNAFRVWLVEHDYHHVMNPQEVRIIDKVKHYIIQCEKDGEKLTFYCLYKHCDEHWVEDHIVLKPQWFWTFPLKFKDFFDAYPNLNSAGESINYSQLILCNNSSYKIIYIYENGSFYSVEPLEILKLHKLAEEFYPLGYNPDKPNDYGFIREQKVVNETISNGCKLLMQERTVSFPIRNFMNKLN